ncbi:MAG: hypothetical protein HEQ38_12635 [Gemmatimonas sp.]|nr:hypothetical protein [Gemmatimonas sp.]
MPRPTASHAIAGSSSRLRPRRSTRRGAARYTIDPFTIAIEEKADLLLRANAAALTVPTVRFVNSAAVVRKEERNYANYRRHRDHAGLRAQLGYDVVHRRSPQIVQAPPCAAPKSCSPPVAGGSTCSKPTS